MNTEDLTHVIRTNIASAKSKRVNQLIQAKIDWSEKSSRNNKIVRWLLQLPDAPYTKEEALDVLLAEAQISVMSSLHDVEAIGIDALQICDAIQMSVVNGLPLRLTVKDVAELRKWL